MLVWIAFYGDGSFLVGDLIQDKFDIAGLNAQVIFGAITGKIHSPFISQFR